MQQRVPPQGEHQGEDYQLSARGRHTRLSLLLDMEEERKKETKRKGKIKRDKYERYERER